MVRNFVSRIRPTAVLLATSFALPGVALAQNSPNTANIESLVASIARIIRTLIPITVALALLYFIWGLAQFILASGDEEKKSEGKNKMIWGIIALFVIVSIYGIISWIGGLLGISQGGALPSPNVQ